MGPIELPQPALIGDFAVLNEITFLSPSSKLSIAGISFGISCCIWALSASRACTPIACDHARHRRHFVWHQAPFVDVPAQHRAFVFFLLLGILGGALLLSFSLKCNPLVFIFYISTSNASTISCYASLRARTKSTPRHQARAVDSSTTLVVLNVESLLLK